MKYDDWALMLSTWTIAETQAYIDAIEERILEMPPTDENLMRKEHTFEYGSLMNQRMACMRRIENLRSEGEPEQLSMVLL